MKLTVITAVYNRINGLKKVIECLNNQTYKDFEHIVIDDCSDEMDYEGLKELCGQPRRHFVRLGVRTHYYGGIARSIGALMAFSYLHASKRDIENEWIAFLDTDNLWEPNHLQSMVETAELHPESMLIASDALWVGANDKEWKEVRPLQLKHGGFDLGQFIYKSKLFRNFGYFEPHPHNKQRYDFRLIEKMINGKDTNLIQTHQPTFIMSYRKR